jgi:4-diphosphocytidyl-2-C-methyl-D-erythritol kinase
MSDAVAILAPAKINLALAVGPPGADGMHPICSWMVTVGLFDQLEVRRLQPDRFSRYAILWHPEARRCTDIDWSITRDLAVQAHLALEHHVDRRLPVQLKFEKRIPVGGGLGGGSADAAAMLHAVNAVYGLGLSVEELCEIGSGVGSDVPFLVRGGSALVHGLGERIEPHDAAPDLYAVLVLPEAACPTRDVYRTYDEIGPIDLREADVRSLCQGIPAAPTPDHLFNDLAEPALCVAPALSELLERLSAIAERPAHVSGSGSSLFVLCDDQLHAEFLAGAIEDQLGEPAVAVGAVARPSPVPVEL